MENLTELASRLFQAGQTTATMDLNEFESHKRVKRCAMNRLDYNKYRGWELPHDENGEDEGYLVEYLDGGKPNHPWHSGYISWSPKEQFDNGYIECNDTQEKSYGNTDVNGAKKNVPDLVIFGDGDLFKLISKASSKNEQWMKSTKAMEVPGVGCLVQVTTQQKDNVAEALQFIRGVTIETVYEGDTAISRTLVPIQKD